jgi:hypothetical protein
MIIHKKNEKKNSEIPISESPINKNPGIESTYFSKDDLAMLERDGLDKFLDTLYARNDTKKEYTIDDLIDVWCRGVTNGATIWQYCQDTKKPLPTSFEAGLIELVNEIRHSDTKAATLQVIINNNMLLLGVFDEKS